MKPMRILIAAAMLTLAATAFAAEDVEKENIRAVQQVLKDCGFNPGAIDGIWGNKTTAAAKSYVRAHGGSPEAENYVILMVKVDHYRLGDSEPCPELQVQARNNLSDGSEVSDDGKDVEEQVVSTLKQAAAFLNIVATLNLVYQQYADDGNLQEAEAIKELTEVLNAIMASLTENQAADSELDNFAIVLNDISASITSGKPLEAVVITTLAQNLVEEYEVDMEFSAAPTNNSLTKVSTSEVCTRNPDDFPDGCWKEVSNIPGCHIWNPYPKNDEIVTWSGGCENGKVSGIGKVVWQWEVEGESRESTGEGSYVNNKAHGHWILKFTSGTFAEGPVVNGKRHGQWTITYPVSEGFESWPNGGVSEGPYVNGERNGHWTETVPWRYKGLYKIYEGPYVDGKKNGVWTITWPRNVQFEEGLYVDGERNGHWVIKGHPEDHTVDEGPYVDGKKNGVWTTWFKGNLSSRGPYVDDEKNGVWAVIMGLNLAGTRLRGYQENYVNGAFQDSQKAIYSMDGELLEWDPDNYW